MIWSCVVPCLPLAWVSPVTLAEADGSNSQFQFLCLESWNSSGRTRLVSFHHGARSKNGRRKI